tara:strand:- start:8413 stop:8928 length:516 start_codon:yes stop_codon:yes gene_type:complete
MKANNLKSLIHQAQAIGKDIPFLNNGGCGVFAANAVRMLDSHGYKTRIWFVNLYDTTYSEGDVAEILINNLLTLSEWANAGVPCNHALIEAVDHEGKSIVFDNEYMFELKKGQVARSRRFPMRDRLYTAGHVEIPKGEFLEMVEDPRGWNCTFDRASHKPSLEKKMLKLAK